MSALLSLFPVVVLAVPLLQTGTASPFAGPAQTKPGPFFAGQADFRPYDTAGNLAFGIAPTNVTSTIPGFAAIHAPAFLTDGYYGNGSSWIPAGTPASFDLDLGGAFQLAEIKLGRDRLGSFSDRALSSLTLSLAGADGIFSTVFDGSVAALTSTIGWTLSISNLGPSPTQFIRIGFGPSSSGNPAIDEIEVFAVSVPEPAVITLLAGGLLGAAATRKRGRKPSRASRDGVRQPHAHG